MRKSAWRLALAAVLFAGWIGYLGWLAATATQPIVLARPQFLAADLYVVAEVPEDPKTPGQPAQEVTVMKQVWPAEAAPKKTIRVRNLNHLDAAERWQGAGEYVLALSKTRDGPDVFEVTPLPRTPGFGGGPGRIYPSTPATRRQLELLAKEYHPEK
jgi:hypothetical protein